MIYIKYILSFSVFVIIILILTSWLQEKLIFYPQKLPADYQFTFKNKFKEYFFKVDRKTKIHGLLFEADSSKGLVFYLHGNAGSNNSWGDIAHFYLENKYDFFMLDYRGYGKSEGSISGEKQIFRDVQTVYDSIKTLYQEEKIVIIGYSIGTGPASYLAVKNNPKLLILKAPYYNLPDLAHHYVKWFPRFLIRYKFRTDKYIPLVKSKVVIFHGDKDEVIYTGSSRKLEALFKQQDTLIILKNQTHNGINENAEYLKYLNKLLHN